MKRLPFTIQNALSGFWQVVILVFYINVTCTYTYCTYSYAKQQCIRYVYRGVYLLSDKKGAQ